MTRAPITLEYHDIIDGDNFEVSGFPGASSASYKLAASEFAAHLRLVASAGSIVTPHVAFGDAAPRQSIMLTFDDGGVSAITSAAPLLEAVGCRGIFLVTSDYIGTAAFLSPPQIRELHTRGHVVGSHSCSHPLRMAACTREQLSREWRDSVAALSDVLGTLVDTASVPGGYFSRAVAETAAEAGIRFLFTSEPTTRVTHVGGSRVIGRYTLRRWHAAPVAAGLVAASSAARSGQWLRWNTLKVAKRLGGDVYLRWRERMLGDA